MAIPLLIVSHGLRTNVAVAQHASGGMGDMSGVVHSVPLDAPIPPITIDAGVEEIDGAGSTLSQSGNFTATGGVTVVGGSEFDLNADAVTGNLKTGVTTAVGHVFLRELDSTIQMDSIFLSEKVREGVAQNVALRQPPYTVQAQRIVFLPNETDAYNAILTTCPPGPVPDFSIRSRLITFLQVQHEIVIHDGAIYLRKSKLFVYRRLVLHTSSHNGVVSTGTKLVSNTFGYNGFSGAFIDFTTHFGLPENSTYASLIVPEKHGVGGIISGSTTLLSARSQKVPPPPKTLIGLIRTSAESTEPILPYGDPLLMHWFQGETPMSDRFLNIPNTLTITATGTVSVRERVFGHQTDDLFYSRLPELTFDAVVPISGPRELPTSRDPAQMRTTLRQIALYAIVTPSIGRYTENPDNVTSDRESIKFDLQSRPIMIGDNLLFKPRVTFANSTYSGTNDSFRVFQYDLAMEKYLSDRTAFGFEYQQSEENGDSPFQFDTPYTSREIDGRFQIGYPKVIVGAVIKYDLVNNNAYSEEILIAPVMRCIIPRFTYDFRDSSFGLGFDIQGLTF